MKKADRSALTLDTATAIAVDYLAIVDGGTDSPPQQQPQQQAAPQQAPAAQDCPPAVAPAPIVARPVVVPAPVILPRPVFVPQPVFAFSGCGPMAMPYYGGWWW